MAADVAAVEQMVAAANEVDPGSAVAHRGLSEQLAKGGQAVHAASAAKPVLHPKPRMRPPIGKKWNSDHGEWEDTPQQITTPPAANLSTHALDSNPPPTSRFRQVSQHQHHAGALLLL